MPTLEERAQKAVKASDVPVYSTSNDRILCSTCARKPKKGELVTVEPDSNVKPGAMCDGCGTLLKAF